MFFTVGYCRPGAGGQPPKTKRGRTAPPLNAFPGNVAGARME
jgi:hypothetical protein